VLLVEERVDVIDETKSSLSSGDSCLGRDGPSVEFLSSVAELIMVSVEGVESPKPGLLALCTTTSVVNLPSPSSTKGLGGVTAETTTISTDHSNTLNGGELEHLTDSLDILFPIRNVIS
jgi:hypothetical protein